MSNKTLNLNPQLYDYMLRISLREHPILKELREQTATMSMAQMQISPEQGQFMALLLELIEAKKSLDIGVFTGYSALVAALAMGKNGHVIGCDINGEWTKLAKKYWQKAGVANQIDLRLAPALQTLQTLIDEGQTDTFDFAFIDADKLNYASYYEKSLQLIRVGGLIAIDNTLWDGDVARPVINDEKTLAIRELNAALLIDKRVTLSVLPIGDGLTLLRKKKVV